MIDKNILKLAIERDAPFQVSKTIEECGELITALAQWQIGRSSNVAKEVADVLIMVQTMRLMFGPDEVDQIIASQMERFRKRIEGLVPINKETTR